MDSEIITNIFGYHPPQDQETVAKHERVRDLCRDAAHELNAILPPCTEKRAAIDALELAMMHANGAIARVDPTTGERKQP